jgi:pyruvate dehydrogenase E1 component alpha subunit
MPGVIVDGQDVLAVHQTVSQAVARARAGGGPTLVEAKTYRYCEHEEGDFIPPYRSQEEQQFWRTRDPIELFSDGLLRRGILTGDELAAIRACAQEEVDEALVFAKESPDPDPAALLEDVFV